VKQSKKTGVLPQVKSRGGRRKRRKNETQSMIQIGDEEKDKIRGKCKGWVQERHIFSTLLLIRFYLFHFFINFISIPVHHLLPISLSFSYTLSPYALSITVIL
jgi:hypothetical protein